MFDLSAAFPRNRPDDGLSEGGASVFGDRISVRVSPELLTEIRGGNTVAVRLEWLSEYRRFEIVPDESLPIGRAIFRIADPETVGILICPETFFDEETVFRIGNRECVVRIERASVPECPSVTERARTEAERILRRIRETEPVTP